MTTTTYKYGKHTCKAYKKPVGKGWEVGFTFGGTQIFVGNFIHAKEANAWWSKMNAEVRKFSKRYAPRKTPHPLSSASFWAITSIKRTTRFWIANSRNTIAITPKPAARWNASSQASSAIGPRALSARLSVAPPNVPCDPVAIFESPPESSQLEAPAKRSRRPKRP